MSLGDSLRAVVDTAQAVVSGVAQEKELPVPEAVINAAIERWLLGGALVSMVARVFEDGLRLDVELMVVGSRLKVAGRFVLQDICINQQMQFLTLRQEGSLDVQALGHRWPWWRTAFLMVWPLRSWLAAFALKTLLNRVDGITSLGSVYHFDLAPYIRREPQLITLVSTVNVVRGRLEDGVLMLGGHINLRGLLA